MSQPYDLVPQNEQPDVPEGVVVRRAAEDAIEAAASDLFYHAMNCVRAFGDFNLALSGGRSPVRLYQALMLDPQFRGFPWKRTHVWVVSEQGDGVGEDSANELLRDLIVEHSDLPIEQFHELDPVSGAEPYARELSETLGWREPGHDRLDYVLLGVGADGSTAGWPAVADLPERPLVYESGEGDNRAVSLGIRTVNGARLIAVLAFGEEKRVAVHRWLTQRDAAHPLHRLDPVGGELRWYIDAEAFGGGDGK